MFDDLFHGARRLCDELFYGTGREPGGTVCLAPIVAELELVQVGLEVACFDGTAMRAKQPAFEQ